MNPFTKLYARKQTTPAKIPLYLDIEFTNHCNLKCKMCGTNYSKRKKGYMSQKTMDRICQYLADNGSLIRIIGWGEPTKHPFFHKYLARLLELTKVHINTNGFKAIRCAPDSIKYSFHGQKPRISYADEVYGTTTDLEPKTNVPEWAKEQLTDTRWIDGKNRSTKRFKRCGEVFDKLTILWNGDITACCGDVEAELVLGNVNKDDILDIWENSRMLNYMRKELKVKNWECTSLCSKCYDYTT